MDYPSRINKISRSDYDFAIYNWFNDDHNEAYIPSNKKIEKGNIDSNLYVYSHHVPYYTTEQLLCCGAVQFYRNSENAKYLLESWQTTLADNPGCSDDECLDYTFNNFILDIKDLKYFWLEKSYVRLPWWPHVKPIILHPGLPLAVKGRHHHPIFEINNRKRFYLERCKKKSTKLIFPSDYLIDTKKQRLFRIINGRTVGVKSIKQRFFIYLEDFGLT
jgi:hypothetical protein